MMPFETTTFYRQKAEACRPAFLELVEAFRSICSVGTPTADQVDAAIHWLNVLGGEYSNDRDLYYTYSYLAMAHAVSSTENPVEPDADCPQTLFQWCGHCRKVFNPLRAPHCTNCYAEPTSH